MGWGLITSFAKETLGCRTMLHAAAGAVIGAMIVAPIGLLFVYATLMHTSLSPHTRTAILIIAGVIYVIAGAVAGVQSVFVSALMRAIGSAVRTMEPTIDGIVAKALSQLPASEKGIEISQIDRLIDRVFDAMKQSAELPILSHIARFVAAVAKWRCRREIEKILAPLRASGETHISATTLRGHLTTAASRTIVSAATMHLRRWRLIVVAIVIALQWAPLAVLAYLKATGGSAGTQPTTQALGWILF